MWPLKTIFYFLLFWGACLASLVNPIWGVVNYMMAYQTNPPVTWWGQPLVNLGMRFSMLAVSFTLVGLLLSRNRIPVVRPIVSLWELYAFALVILSLFGIILGIGYGIQAQLAFEKFWKLQVFVLILARLATNRRNLGIVIWTIVVGSLYLGHDAYTAPQSAFTKGRLEVFGGPDISTSSGAAAHLTSMLPIIGIAFLTATRLPLRILAAVSGAFTVNAVILCRTRSAFVGLACGALAALLLAPRARRFRVRILLGLGAVLAFSLTDSHYWTRMSTMLDSRILTDDQATVSRSDIWRASMHILSDHPLGVGLGNFATIIGSYDSRYENRSPHNTLILCFAELGILGGILFLAVLLESVRLLYQSVRLAPYSARPLETSLIAYGLMVALVTYFVAGLGTERFSCESFWWVLVLPLCLNRIVRREVEEGAAAPVPALVSDRRGSGALTWGLPAHGF